MWPFKKKEVTKPEPKWEPPEEDRWMYRWVPPMPLGAPPFIRFIPSRWVLTRTGKHIMRIRGIE